MLRLFALLGISVSLLAACEPGGATMGPQPGEELSDPTDGFENENQVN